MLKTMSGLYCKLKPPPRSTIAAAFSPDGEILASTHGDHTVKIICCRTGNCLNVLPGHRRTPWVVTFHPRTSHILASGSLDHEVRIWNAKSSECISTHEFGRPIASLAFHAHGDVIGIASGHQLYIWDYSRSGLGDPKPVSVLRTKRSLRAVHFHPFGIPILLSAEVNDQDSTQDLAQAHCTMKWRDALNDYNYNRNMVTPDAPVNTPVGPAGPGMEESSGRGRRAQTQTFRHVTNMQAPHGQASTSATHNQGGGAARNATTGRRWQGLSGIFRTNFPPNAPYRPEEDANATQAAVAAAAAASAAMSQDMPCTVRLRIWPFDIKSPQKPLEKEILEIRHAVLCSEMGAHFSPCGRYLATCIACHPPPDMVVDNTPLGPVTALFYELRIYSMESETFGQILHARPIRAAHCLTSIRFSPTSEHLLLAYGRRHMTLLQSIVADAGTGNLIPIHTILEIYRVSDMQLVRVLPSAEDEVNVATWSPFPGGGIAYGTKEGKLRLLGNYESDSFSIEDELLQVGVLGNSDSGEEY
uniref:WD40 repeat domain-containing protein n=3 Tax=Chloropicon primus TaxID=1764295 RepID=A0A7S2WZ10_9CHLO|mmetsp:Transcript_296/g.739  ORF Transcript_296/g.739 Transcript_296/m.739 type:complete len:529 (+) Transcript_296:739-2325(+)